MARSLPEGQGCAGTNGKGLTQAKGRESLRAMGSSVSDIEILILAAGRSSRMRGADKLMQDVDGQPLLRQIVARAMATGAGVTVALPPDRPARIAALAGLDCRSVTVTDPGAGMAASIAAGVAAIPVGRPILLVLADLPEITMDDLTCLLQAGRASPNGILRGATADGEMGHPVLFPPDLREALLSLTGDEGARSILRAHAGRVVPIALPARHAVTDLDTPEDWDRWRAARDLS